MRALVERLRWTTAAVSFACTAVSAWPASAWLAQVTHVTDGDTVWVRPERGGKPVKLRISAMDAPEICQAGGVAAQAALARRLAGRQLAVTSLGRDDYGRTVTVIRLQGEDIGAWMVSQGHAWSSRYGREGGPYFSLQQQAQAAGRGLFEDRSSIRPVVFRKRHGPCRH
jgi:micrococcal nuclease